MNETDLHLVDTHCHLDFEPLAADPEAVLRRARARGVTRVVVPSFDRESRLRVAQLANLSGVYPAFGHHPWAADKELDLGELRALLDAGAVALGEVGLDTKVETPSLRRQCRVLDAQLNLAATLSLPVILHCRGAFDELLQLLGRYRPPLRGVVHAFSKGPQLARRLTEAGLLLGIGGAATRPAATRLRRTLTAISLDHLVLETDAPAIGLEGVAAGDCEPHHVADVAVAVAELSGHSVSTVIAATTSNACTLFGGLE